MNAPGHSTYPYSSKELQRVSLCCLRGGISESSKQGKRRKEAIEFLAEGLNEGVDLSSVPLPYRSFPVYFDKIPYHGQCSALPRSNIPRDNVSKLTRWSLRGLLSVYQILTLESLLASSSIGFLVDRPLGGDRLLSVLLPIQPLNSLRIQVDGYARLLVRGPIFQDSDHHLLSVKFDTLMPDYVEKAFRFEHAWLAHDEFLEFVKQSWGSQNMMGNLTNIAADMRQWSRICFGNIYKRKRTQSSCQTEWGTKAAG
ncbi:RNA-directed DNA polymerase [Striga asiatica]|uniref:RNA-directed DNA polymerase n=1 Tax=Striga asiatica TaxID=4170 RepID=A0A5A7R228_STRAF|nr:RNA-directed DNA polymerase [Striga asiatica]